ncbi:hypothetical protein QO003_002325 [Arthrobacter silviterrae]|uniref:Pr6Pr family membrane protein n=1 Tax=Arthrobacter silviterrae TaxID=2026658 RepID=A0ABX0D9K3_9MICC|nr:Pr6Pr family membrane protein [Arthrobacter silviterrae]MDQ0278022.1 hypothetical protein [Arthrobacter silviterrae]NGN83576.1 hypothetical protein [Arthrobacter silviterrae]
MTLRRVLAALRFLLGAVTLTAVGIQLGIHISHGFNVLNFFSYFTNLSNIFAACVLLVESVLAWRGRELGPLWQLARCASVVSMALVGIVFSALLRDVDLGSLLPWINTWLHYVMPVVVVLDWLVQSPRLPIAFRRLSLVLLLPVVYLAYSLVRGAAINWYAYPFLNPANGGYGTVALTCVLIAVAFLAVSAVLVVAGNKLRPLIAPTAVSGSVPAGR